MGFTFRPLAAAVAALIGATGLAGCATTQAAPGPVAAQPSTAAEFNDTDVQFTQQMIGHHQQALMMSKVAVERAQDAEVKQLAAQIEAEQAPEIEQMSGWLRQWGNSVPSMGAMPDMGQMQGMSAEQFDHTFLQMMIAHHEGAVTMAEAEVAGGANPAAKQLAERIQASQSAQIEQMRQMLGAVPSPTST